MTLRTAVATSLLAVSMTAPLMADDARTTAQVSATVVRSCRVAADQPQVSVDCGSRPQPVRVSVDGGAPSDRTVTSQTNVTAGSATVVTLQF